jgi:addiction module HigA family antidote
MELEGRNVKQKDFAEVLGISKVEVSNLINGKRNITPRLAVRIGEAFGTGPETWINLQTIYDLWLLKQNKAEVKERKVIPKRMSTFYSQVSLQDRNSFVTA